MIFIELTEENLNGKIFNRWLVLEYDHNEGYNKYYKCKCLDCGNIYVRYIQSITSGKSQSCGCKSRLWIGNLNKKNNEYEYLEDNIVSVTLTNTGNKMICNETDWEKLKEYYWSEASDYAATRIDKKFYLFHRMLLGVSDPKIQIDHINKNKLDNRRSNLRICCNQQNSFNKWKNSNNTSGYKGVYFDKERQKWRGTIQYNGKHYSSPKRYNTPEEAYQWYIQKSNELFGDFSVFKSE